MATIEEPRGSGSSLQEQMIVALARLAVSDASQRINRFGRVIALALDLRNDANYEALLIAHEYEHVWMTSSFERLAEAMGKASNTCLPLGIEATKRYLETDDELSLRRDQYLSLSREYVNRRIGDAVRQKLSHSPHLQQELDSYVSAIRPNGADVRFDQLIEAVSLDLFGPKRSLMSGFRERIRRLEGELIRLDGWDVPRPGDATLGAEDA